MTSDDHLEIVVSDDKDTLARTTAAAMWSADEASRYMGIQLDEIRAGYARARMVVASTMVNGHDICHGGYVFALADTAFAFASNTDGIRTVAAACDIVFVAPARRGAELVAEASERVRFGRSGIYDVTVRQEDGSVVAEFRGHSRAVAGRLIVPEA
jgi:acyl-CoA thioesterase